MSEVEKWKNWKNSPAYGELLFKRAIGELPEMESSKSVAAKLKGVYQPGDTILDVGCGAGHYLRSYRRELGKDFQFFGLDATPPYVELAKKAFHTDPNARFEIGDIFDIGLAEAAHDIVTCNNVLLHIPSIQKPLSELVRVAKKHVFVRFLFGDRTFIIKDIHPNEVELDANGEPLGFNYFNIYSENYVSQILRGIPRAKKWTFTKDVQFDAQGIVASMEANKGAYNPTTMLGQHQLNGYILQPWGILRIDL